MSLNFIGGLNLVSFIPLIADLYSSKFGILPRIEDSTTTGVELSNDSPFFPYLESLTTLPLNNLVDVDIVSPFCLFLITHA